MKYFLIIGFLMLLSFSTYNSYGNNIYIDNQVEIEDCKEYPNSNCSISGNNNTVNCIQQSQDVDINTEKKKQDVDIKQENEEDSELSQSKFADDSLLLLKSIGYHFKRIWEHRGLIVLDAGQLIKISVPFTA